MTRPEVRYAATPDGVELAYHRCGSGGPDIVWLPHFLFNLDLFWDFPPLARWLESLGSLGHVVIRDQRGVGMSDRSVEPADIATDAADIITILDQERVDRAAVIGNLRGAALAVFAAASHPDRFSSLVLWHPQARTMRADDYPWGMDHDEAVAELDGIDAWWGTAQAGAELAGGEGPAGEVDAAMHAWMARMMRSAVTPGRARYLIERANHTDVRDILGAVQVPTLVLTREDTRPDEATWIASRIPDAQLVTLPGEDLMPWFGDMDGVIDEIGRFLGVERSPVRPDRFLASVLFTDIVGSTSKAAHLGDARWAELVGEHHRLVRGLLDRWGGREMDTAGDGFFAAFDSPADAVRCGMAIGSAVHRLGLDVRAGVHTGECHEVDGKVAGLTVTIGARIASLADPGGVLASETVLELTAGSGLRFEGAGVHELKGIPDRWQLHRAVDG
jgi:class 3 adenylate cyclase